MYKPLELVCVQASETRKLSLRKAREGGGRWLQGGPCLHPLLPPASAPSAKAGGAKKGRPILSDASLPTTLTSLTTTTMAKSAVDDTRKRKEGGLWERSDGRRARISAQRDLLLGGASVSMSITIRLAHVFLDLFEACGSHLERSLTVVLQFLHPSAAPAQLSASTLLGRRAPDRGSRFSLLRRPLSSAAHPSSPLPARSHQTCPWSPFRCYFHFSFPLYSPTALPPRHHRSQPPPSARLRLTAAVPCLIRSPLSLRRQ